MIRRPPRSTLSSSSAASDVYKRQPAGVGGRLQLAPAAMVARLTPLRVTVGQLREPRARPAAGAPKVAGRRQPARAAVALCRRGGLRTVPDLVRRGGDLFYWLTKVILTPILRFLFRPYVEGLENVPEAGGVILASNHVSFSDSVFLPLVVPRRVTFLAKSDYFVGRGIVGRLKVSFFRGIGQVPLDRSGGAASEAAVRTALRILADGNVLGIYPEGTRSPDGRLYRGKTGVARMALDARVPVAPVAMIGTYEIQPPGRLVPRR